MNIKKQVMQYLKISNKYVIIFFCLKKKVHLVWVQVGFEQSLLWYLFKPYIWPLKQLGHTDLWNVYLKRHSHEDLSCWRRRSSLSLFVRAVIYSCETWEKNHLTKPHSSKQWGEKIHFFTVFISKKRTPTTTERVPDIYPEKLKLIARAEKEGRLMKTSED